MSSIRLMRGAAGITAIMTAVTEPITELPDTLVLGAGGTLGEAWMRGLLSGLSAASGLDFRECEYVMGTSAGSIVAATLASGRELEAGDRAARAWADDDPSPARHGVGGAARALLRAGTVAASPLAPLAFAGLTPAGRIARTAALAASPRPRRRLDRLAGYLDRLGARFDGRLRIVAVDRGRGARVLFGAPGAPDATVRDAVLASCAVPWLFAPVTIDGREFVDGGVWSPVNLDAAPGGRGAHVLCLAPTAGGGPLRPLTRAALVAEEMALVARGMRVRVVVPDDGSVSAIGPRLMDAARVEGVLDAGFAQGWRLGRRTAAG
jgi:NTE family protein